jgi:hypothetical protein
MSESSDANSRLSRRRLFELGGTGALLAAVLAACGGDDGAGPGRVGFAPAASELPEPDVDDAVYLRTLSSLEQSILAIYARLQSDAGIDGPAAEALARFADDHESAAATLARLTADAGGEAYECPNPWYEERFFGPTLDRILGNDEAMPPVPPSDDSARDALAFAYALESLSVSSYLRFVELVSPPAVRAQLARLGAAAARRAATTALYHHGGSEGYVSPDLLALNPATEGTDVDAPADTTGEAAITPLYALTARFAQLGAASLQVGAVDDAGLRYTTAFETPAENAFIYLSLTCSA